MGSLKVATIMNEKFKKEGTNIRVIRAMAYKILIKHLGKIRKMKGIFYTKKEKNIERMKCV